VPGPPPPRSTPVVSLHRLWLSIGDGLQVQRVHLHLAEWREVVASEALLPDVSGVDRVAVLATSVESDDVPASGRIDAAGLRPWVNLAGRYAFRAGPANVLAPSAAAQVSELVADGVGQEPAADLTAVCSAAAWWVGFFAIIRHRGVHHLTLEPDKPTVTRTVLEEACGVVALGMAIRVLEEHLRSDGVADGQLRRAYCRALATSVAVERRMPQLLAELAELRLVDLVSMAVPWRGRFTKYAGGTGPGQVE
jgi:hypothetical protein